MKKVLFAIALFTFVGTVASTAYAATNGVSTEIKKEDKKKKKKKKSSCCTADQKKAESSCAKPGTEGKACCSSKKQ
jgi:hypothetical protein